MAQVSIKDFDWNKDYYAFVCIGGYECYSGRFRAWKLYSLTSKAVKILGQHPDEVEALFETQEELEAYLAVRYNRPATEPEAETKHHTIGKGPNKLFISKIL